ncbi:CD209 antigen-like protein C [Pseudoliparis swirei]|uniref:CD209 antigen-like protein C n=1 Tax=Pseudoliparis swirei TaxID=2059687 RepID=UPI0024BE155F|nr:CD209 antigen-like protein C [Pseudoliparis swirei]
MSTPGGSLACEGMYSKLIDDDGAYENSTREPDVRLRAHPVSPVRPGPWPRGPMPYRLAAACLAALCAVLLISIIAVTAHYRNAARGGGAAAQQQTQDAAVSSLSATVTKLQEEKKQLQREKDELLGRLEAPRAPRATAAPEVTAPPPRCPADWHLFNGSCYFVSRTTRDWPESQSFCQSQGGHLAIILTAGEQTFLWDLLPRGHWRAFWFGITDEHTEDQWRWVDGTPLVGGFWEAGEPNNHIDEDCGYIVKTQVLERVAVRSWYDAPCSMYWPFICEKEMAAAAGTAVPH